MSTRHRRTLAAVFRDPVSATLAWDDVEKLLAHHGAILRERRGSRVAVTLCGRTLMLQAGETPQHTVRYVRELLTLAGVTP